MKKIFSLIILVSIFNLNFAQKSVTISKEIIWKDKAPIENFDETSSVTKYFLGFENAIYNNFKTFLPYFSEKIYISDKNLQKEDVEVKLLNQNFIAFQKNETSDVDFLSDLNENIEFDYSVTQCRGVTYLIVTFIPIVNQSNTYKKLTSFDIEIIIDEKSSSSKSKTNSFALSSVLASGTWVKIKIANDGVYKLTYEQLQTLGFSTPSNVRVFGNNFGMQPFNNDEPRTDDLIENKIYKGSDYILFYAKGSDTWIYNETDLMFLPKNHLYTDTAFYFLTDKNTGWDNSISTENQSTQIANVTVSSYDSFDYHESDTKNLINSGRNWYGEIFAYSDSQLFSFIFPNIISGTNIKMKISLIARSSSKSTFTLTAPNFNKVLEIDAIKSETDTYAKTNTSINNITASNSNDFNLNIKYSGTASSEGFLDYIILNSRNNLTYNNSQLIFRDLSSVGSGNISNFNISNSNSNVIIWNITESTSPIQVNATLSGTTHSFKLETSNLKEFVVFDMNNVLTPILTGAETVTNQNLHSYSGDIDMVILTYPDFIAQSEELAQIHRDRDNMNVAVVSTNQVYNEFSGGAPDVSAYKYFFKMIYDRATSDTLKYALLMGDGSYINKGNYSGNTNYILTYQSPQSLNETYITFVSDDYFGWLDDNEGENYDFLHTEDLLDIGIGRMPVKTTGEATDMVEKVKSYLNNENMKDWRNTICFIADDEDSNLHMRQAEEMAQKLDTLFPAFNIKKIYLDAYVQEVSSLGDMYPAATEAVNNKMTQGALIMNYTGHGSPSRLTHENVISRTDILSWSNFEKLPVFVTATCEFSRYDDYSQLLMKDATSAGEQLFLNSDGGGIASLTTTRVVYSGANERLNNNFYKYAFAKSNGKRYRLGDIVRLTKNETGGSNSLNFTLLGDPALEIAYAEYNVNTTKINNINIENELDTLNALSLVTIEGEVTDLSNNIMSDFNGIVYPSVYDKSQNLFTMNNDGDGVFEYQSQNSILYRGQASVTNGIFTFSFIVPRDILYNYGYGKLSYYATDLSIDAKGCFQEFIIGGTSDNYAIDEIGPEINLYLNDETFVSGSISDANPMIYALLADSSGINTVNTGIGHDITAIVDNNLNDTKILNDFYEADLDSYQSGKVKYNLYKLPEGEHKLKFKAWDVYNNSASEEIDFIVVEADELTIERLYNYPNPFTTKTSFYFEHNMPETDLEVLLQIFTVSGKLVKTIELPMITNGYKSEGIEWDGLDDYGSRIGKGVYLYRVRVKTSEGEIVEKFEKLLILK